MKIRFIFLTILLFISSICSFAKNIITNPDKNTQLDIIKNSYSVLLLKNTASNIILSNVNTVNGNFVKVEIPGYGKSLNVGDPELPVLKNLIEIPYEAQIEVQIISSSFKDYSLTNMGYSHFVIPARAPISKNIDDPGSVEYIVNSNTYSSNTFIGQENVNIEILGTMRGVRLGRLEIAPVQYNPVSNTLRVFDKLEIRITFKNSNIPYTKSSKKGLFSPFYENLYSKILNYKPLENKELITDSPATFMIVSDPMFHDNLQPFIEWKSKKGFRVITAYTDDPNVGNTTVSIKAYLENFYNNPPEGYNAQSFILFVGDVEQVPAYTGNYGNHATDLYYAEYTGDIFPDCYYGRFSANNPDELETQIAKNLEYETFQFPQATYLDSSLLIAGKAPGYDSIWGVGQLNYMINNYLNQDNGIFTHLITPPFSPDTNYTEQLIQTISNGISFVNYTGHCSVFGFANPPLSIGNIPDLTNEHLYPLVVGNCCSSASFQSWCFGEELVRASNKGALSYIGAANLTYWDEDYWWMVGFKEISSNPPYSIDNLGLIDRWFHSNNETMAEWYITQGQLPIAGNLAITQSGSQQEGYYWEVYNLLGDPSVMNYLPKPELPEVYYSSSITQETETLIVNTEPFLYAALSMNNVLHGTGMADENGIAIIDIFLPFTETGTADIVITGQNIQPFFGTIQVVDAQGAYVVMQSFEIDDSNGNNNGNVDAGENILLNVTLGNLGNMPSSGLTANLSTADTNIILTNTTNTWLSLEPGDSEINYGAFSFDVGQFCLNGHIAEFTVEISDNTNTWYSEFSLTLHSLITEIPEIYQSEPISNLSIYPNPFSNKVQIDFDLSNTSNIKISFIDLFGKQHLGIERRNLQSNGRHNVVLDTKRLPPGLYLCKIQTGNYSLIKRIILAR